MREDELLESTIRSKIVRVINSRGKGAVQIRHQGGYNKKGDPDLVGVYRKYHMEIEVKRQKNRPTRLQKERLAFWAAHGAIVAVLYSEAGARKFIEIVDDAIDRGIIEHLNFVYDEHTGGPHPEITVIQERHH